MRFATVTLVSFAMVAASPSMGCDGPPRVEDIAGEIRAMRGMFDGVSLTYHIERRAYVGEAMREIRSQRLSCELTVRDGCKRLRQTIYDMDQPIGVGPSRTGTAFFDGRDSYRVVERPAHSSFPGVPVYVKPGFCEEVFPTHILDNYESAVWGDMVRPLDEVIESNLYAVTISSRTEIIRGHEVWTVTLRSRPSDSGIMEEWSVAVAPDLGMLPIQSTLVMYRSDGSDQFISGKWAEDFTEVKPGLWIPRTITFGDPRNPDGETFTRLQATSIDPAPELGVMLSGITTGPRDMIDYRTNERYSIDNGESGPRQRITDAAAIQRELDQYMSLAPDVKLAKGSSDERPGSGLRFPLMLCLSAGVGVVGVALGLRGLRKV